MYYQSSENKGADQLRGYREADLCLCFRLCRLLVFPWGGSFYCRYVTELSILETYSTVIFFSMFQYLESMSEMIMKGIEEASKDLRVEHDHKLVQEVCIKMSMQFPSNSRTCAP